jgi:DNA replication protein DnaC
MSTTTADTPQVLLEHHLKALRLPTMLRETGAPTDRSSPVGWEYDKQARTCAVEKANFPNYLLRLTELELLDRNRRSTERRIRQAKFPVARVSTASTSLPSLR